MKEKSALLRGIALAVFMLSASGLLAAPKKIYIHGFSPVSWDGYKNKECQGKTTCDYWKGIKLDSSNPGKMVGWQSQDPWPYYGVPQALTILNQECRTEMCQIICHSTGCAIAGYILDKHGKTYKISNVVDLASAAGGTPFATMASNVEFILAVASLGLSNFLTGTGVYYLIPASTRSWYDHNNTNGVPIYESAGMAAWWKVILIQWVFGLSGNDGVVPIASSCGYNQDIQTDVCTGGGYWGWTMNKTCVSGACTYLPALKFYTVGQWKSHYRQSGMGNKAHDLVHSDFIDGKYNNLHRQ
ncbi:MAG: hypothetical protein K8S54_18700 [Spirochaetia bacterium]|nr:hypothetical protein [Spirochaetia bacterium]